MKTHRFLGSLARIARGGMLKPTRHATLLREGRSTGGIFATSKKSQVFLAVLLVGMVRPTAATAMHIMEGFLPPLWAGIWTVLALPFLFIGLSRMNSLIRENPRATILLAMVGAFAFVLSALKIPSVTGSCSHPTGVGLAAILFGPTITSVLGFIVLLFQALLLAHGGLTTLGANTFSMAVVGPLVAYGVYVLVNKSRGPQWLAVFLAAALGNLLTYVVTSFQLALAFPAEVGGFAESLTRFMGVFAITQIPLAISEGILTVIVFNAIIVRGGDILDGLKRNARKQGEEMA